MALSTVHALHIKVIWAVFCLVENTCLAERFALKQCHVQKTEFDFTVVSLSIRLGGYYMQYYPAT